jgi:hypothetical protein
MFKSVLTAAVSCASIVTFTLVLFCCTNSSLFTDNSYSNCVSSDISKMSKTATAMPSYCRSSTLPSLLTRNCCYMAALRCNSERCCVGQSADGIREKKIFQLKQHRPTASSSRPCSPSPCPKEAAAPAARHAVGLCTKWLDDDARYELRSRMRRHLFCIGACALSQRSSETRIHLSHDSTRRSAAKHDAPLVR